MRKILLIGSTTDLEGGNLKKTMLKLVFVGYTVVQYVTNTDAFDIFDAMNVLRDPECIGMAYMNPIGDVGITECLIWLAGYLGKSATDYRNVDNLVIKAVEDGIANMEIEEADTK